MPAASVGEAMPVIIDPRTAKIRKKGGISVEISSKKFSCF